MKKRQIWILMLILALCIMTGCAAGGANVKCTDIVKACKAVTAEDSLDEYYSYGEELYDDSFSSLYAVRFDMIDDGAVLQTAAGGKADELSILHLKKNEDVQLARSKLSDRLSERMELFAGYKPEEVYKLENARIIIQGNYVALIVSDEADAIEAEIRRVISEGASD